MESAERRPKRNNDRYMKKATKKQNMVGNK
jgi:hypothetical protein